jgi:hypothetical protein
MNAGRFELNPEILTLALTLPHGCRITDAYRDEYDRLMVTVQGPMLPEVGEGKLVPTIEPLCTKTFNSEEGRWEFTWRFA